MVESASTGLETRSRPDRYRWLRRGAASSATLTLTLALLFLAAAQSACGPNKKSSGNTLPEHRAGADEHLEQARRHEREAAVHERQKPSAMVQPENKKDPSGLQCVDQPLAGIPDSGGKPLNVLRPCWTSVLTPTEAHRAEAERHRKMAAKHRAAAAKLRDTERSACEGLGEGEVSESPFWHKEDILGVRSVRTKKGALRGAVITFRRVPGLTVDFLRRASECHQARAAFLGYPSTFMTYCPLVLGDATFRVGEAADGFEITVTSRRSEIAAAIWARVKDMAKK